MSPLANTEALLQKRLGELKTQCLRGSEGAPVTLVFSGNLCAKLLSELLLQHKTKGSAAVEHAARTAKAWPISYPSLDDGRNNRIREQLPDGLKGSLKISRSYLKATGRQSDEHQEVETFLQHSLTHKSHFESGGKKRSELASIMGALIVLHRDCVRGNGDAASIVADFGVRISELLKELLNSSGDSKIEGAIRTTSRQASEWPIHLGHKENLKQLHLRVPDDLGRDLGFRICKKSGTRADRDLSKDARSGFAFAYFKDLDTARKLAREYESPDDAHYSRLIKQGNAALQVLSDSNYKKKRSHVLPKINAALPADLLGLAQIPIADVPLGYQDIAAITKRLLNVVPFGTHPMWAELRELPNLSQDSLQCWINTAMRLAEIRCKGNWAKGEWPPMIAEAAMKRLIASGAKDEDYLYKEVVGLWLKQGFHSFVNDSD